MGGGSRERTHQRKTDIGSGWTKVRDSAKLVDKELMKKVNVTQKFC